MPPAPPAHLKSATALSKWVCTIVQKEMGKIFGLDGQSTKTFQILFKKCYHNCALYKILVKHIPVLSDTVTKSEQVQAIWIQYTVFGGLRLAWRRGSRSSPWCGCSLVDVVADNNRKCCYAASHGSHSAMGSAASHVVNFHCSIGDSSDNHFCKDTVYQKRRSAFSPRFTKIMGLHYGLVRLKSGAQKDYQWPDIGLPW